MSFAPVSELAEQNSLLSRREVEVLALLVEGRSNTEIADVLYISKRTVDNHLCRAYEKLGVNNRVKAIRKALTMGLI